MFILLINELTICNDVDSTRGISLISDMCGSLNFHFN